MKTPKIQHSPQSKLRLFECSTSGGQFTNRFGVSELVASQRQSVALTLQKTSLALDRFQQLVEARGFEPLTSGLQSPRSAKLSYAPSKAFKGWLRGRDLNPRPLGYEPNELPDCSTPRHEPESLGGPG
jgi:hypothetical protein